MTVGLWDSGRVGQWSVGDDGDDAAAVLHLIQAVRHRRSLSFTTGCSAMFSAPFCCCFCVVFFFCFFVASWWFCAGLWGFGGAGKMLFFVRPASRLALKKSGDC